MSLTAYSEFCGFGGDSQGWRAIPDVETVLAANHARIAVEVHERNFPHARHILGDITKQDLTRFPRADLFWASPSCPAWTDARGRRRDFDRSTQPALFEDETPEQQAERVRLAKRRALMEEVPRYLRAMADRGEPVLAGVVENVVQCRKWDQWRRWLREIETAAPDGYTVRVIALNAAHARPVRTVWTPQSRNRLFVAYLWNRIGRRPDWDKWLRPRAWCPSCRRDVEAIQVFRDPRADMGSHGEQYDYKCPRHGCRGQVVQPQTMPASSAIDPALGTGLAIGDPRRGTGPGTGRKLVANTIERVRIGLTRMAGPDPRPGSVPAWITIMRGGGSIVSGHHSVDAPLDTFSAQGFHHALVHPPAQFLMSYYRSGSVRPVSQAMATLTTRDRLALISHSADTGDGAGGGVDVMACTLRMLATSEMHTGMGFLPDYQVHGSDEQKKTGYGNAVAPNCAEVIGSALVEAITGTDLERDLTPEPAVGTRIPAGEDQGTNPSTTATSSTATDSTRITAQAAGIRRGRCR